MRTTVRVRAGVATAAYRFPPSVAAGARTRKVRLPEVGAVTVNENRPAEELFLVAMVTHDDPLRRCSLTVRARFGGSAPDSVTLAAGATTASERVNDPAVARRAAASPGAAPSASASTGASTAASRA